MGYVVKVTIHIEDNIYVGTEWEDGLISIKRLDSMAIVKCIINSYINNYGLNVNNINMNEIARAAYDSITAEQCATEYAEYVARLRNIRP
jgi:hypothetical protein